MKRKMVLLARQPAEALTLRVVPAQEVLSHREETDLHSQAVPQSSR